MPDCLRKPIICLKFIKWKWRKALRVHLAMLQQFPCNKMPTLKIENSILFHVTHRRKIPDILEMHEYVANLPLWIWLQEFNSKYVGPGCLFELCDIWCILIFSIVCKCNCFPVFPNDWPSNIKSSKKLSKWSYTKHNAKARLM